MIKDASDWTWFDKSVVVKLKELDCSGYRIIFVTNQAGIEKGKVKFLELKCCKRNAKSEIQTADLPIAEPMHRPPDHGDPLYGGRIFRF